MLRARALRGAIAAALMAVVVDDGRLTRLHEELRDTLPRYDRGYRRPVSRRTGKLYPFNRPRECARRMAQIAAGRIKPANGLQVAS